MGINLHKKPNKLTYISLFSGAGIGCYGFKKQNFECIATTELLEKRMNIQKANNKCKFDSGYIVGDITSDEISNKIFNEINKWNKKQDVDVVIATPPCQGMSLANQKKKNELKRNSLVVKAIELVNKIHPKIFIFENVFRFLKTTCSGQDGILRTISEEIDINLSDQYLISSKIINFKNYGSNSSRTRTLVVGVRKDMLNLITPFEIFPDWEEEKKLIDVIGNFKSLKNMNDFDENNVLHHFKPYDNRMINWIKNLKEGQSAFENSDMENIPHKIINGKVKYYSNEFGDKYKRQFWNKVAPCIHTANDCLASQNTIHPIDNRVFSIAELMEIMSIPKDFKWTDVDPNSLMNDEEKINWLEKNQGNIRKSIGEAVPTKIFEKMAINIKKCFYEKDIYQDIKKFELNNSKREKNAAFYTSKLNAGYIFNSLPDFKNKKEIFILEPSVGGGSLLIPLFKKYETYEKVNLMIIDVDKKSLCFLKKTLKKISIPKNFIITFINKNYLDFKFEIKFDLIIGNPPFIKIKTSEFTNLFEAFWYKSYNNASYLIFVNPKYLLSSSLYGNLRNKLQKNICEIIDFGEKGFKGVKIETIAIKLNNLVKRDLLDVVSLPRNIEFTQSKKYVFDSKLSYWIIYRNNKFDDIYFKMKRNIFSFYKNYEVSNSILKNSFEKNDVWVIRSKNVDIDKPKLINIKNYDKYINIKDVKNTKFYDLIKNKNDLFLIPTLTYYPRIIKMPKNVWVNGSVLVAELKDKSIKITNKDIDFFYTSKFREFYTIAFNYSTRTLNVDKNTIGYFGVIRDE